METFYGIQEIHHLSRALPGMFTVTTTVGLAKCSLTQIDTTWHQLEQITVSSHVASALLFTNVLVAVSTEWICVPWSLGDPQELRASTKDKLHARGMLSWTLTVLAESKWPATTYGFDFQSSTVRRMLRFSASRDVLHY
jgi:hypothetical protein